MILFYFQLLLILALIFDTIHEKLSCKLIRFKKFTQEFIESSSLVFLTVPFELI